MISRPAYLARIDRAFAINPVAALLGPRQCGKTTLAAEYATRRKKRGQIHMFDLENPADLARLNNPMFALGGLSGLVIIDEIQRRPDLFPILRVIVDRNRKARFLILGSASPGLIRQGSESLAGRIRFVEMAPFSVMEVDDHRRLWLRGGFPKSYLARSRRLSREWLDAYAATFLERDIPNLGVHIPPAALRRFWMMLAHYHGQIFNASEIGRSLGVADTTARRYLDLLTGAFMIRQLQPWIENVKKRQVKSPKVYFRDSGLFHALMGLETERDLMRHPKLGASWEGFAMEQTIQVSGLSSGEVFFWSSHGEAEVDLLLMRRGKRVGVEIKFTDAPRLTRALRVAMDTLKLDRLYIVYPGEKSFALADSVYVTGFPDIGGMFG